MARNRLRVFDSSVQKANLWLKDLEGELHLQDRPKAYSALRTVLHALRDCMRPEDAAKFASQLPLIVSGMFFDGWKPHPKPKRMTRDEFFTYIREGLRNQPGLDASLAVFGVIRLLAKHHGGGTAGLVMILPRDVRAVWLQALEEGEPQAGPVLGRGRTGFPRRGAADGGLSRRRRGDNARKEEGRTKDQPAQGRQPRGPVQGQSQPNV